MRLNGKELVMKGGISGAAIIPGNSKDSRLMKRVLALKAMKRGCRSAAPRWKANQIELIRKWIDQGAIWPEGGAGERARGERASSLPQHWAFVAPTPETARRKNSSWFARRLTTSSSLARKQGLAPSPEAGQGHADSPPESRSDRTAADD